MKKFDYPSSCIAYSRGNGKFEIQKLPAQVQFSSVNAALCTDLNNDGKNDVILGGNKFDMLPQFCRLDASYGNVLINNGNKNFSMLESNQSGLEVEGQVKDIKLINSKDKKYILFLRNNDYPAMYKINNSK